MMITILDLQFLGLKQTIASFLIKTDEGPVLVETGPHSVLPNLEKGLNQAGYGIKDIKHVLLTHIHLDHAGAAWAFAQNGANIYLHPFGSAHMADPTKLINSAKRIYQDQMERLWGELKPIPEDRLKTTAHEEEIVIGDCKFKAIYTPGHAVHHIAWQLEDSLFTGDVGGVKIGNGLIVPPCPPPDINIEDWQASIALIKSLDIKKIYLTHFGKVENITEHLDALEKMLIDWADWIKEHWENGETAQEMTPGFQKYVEGQLRNHGIDESGLAQYEAANPSWMSVAGLIRYWKKRAEGTVK